MVGYYDECLEICDECIHLAKKTSRCTYLGEVLYNRAWALVRRNQNGDRIAAAHFAAQSRNFFEVMGNVSAMKFVEEFIDKNGLMDSAHTGT